MRLHLWLVNIVPGNGLAPSGDMASLGHSELKHLGLDNVADIFHERKLIYFQYIYPETCSKAWRYNQ